MRTATRALSGDARLLAVLQEGAFRGRVHSVFARTVNIEGPGSRLFAIAGHSVDDAPDTLVVDQPGFNAIDVRSGDAVTADGGVLAVGDALQVRLDGAARWEAALPRYPADDCLLRRNLRVVAGQLARLGRAAAAPSWQPSVLCSTTGPLGYGLALATSRALAQRAAALCAALQGENHAAARVHGIAMLGLGPGLTPSGDDFLVGLFAVLHVPGGPCFNLRRICADIVAEVEPRTNAISAATLRAAANGRVREGVQRLLGAMTSASEAEVTDALAFVLAIGSTSGHDIVAGVVAGVRLQLAGAAPRGIGGRAGWRFKRSPRVDERALRWRVHGAPALMNEGNRSR